MACSHYAINKADRYYYSDMSLKMAEQFNASLKGEKSPEEAIATLDRELQEIVDLGETS